MWVSLHLADQFVVGFEVVEEGGGGGVDADFPADAGAPFLDSSLS